MASEPMGIGIYGSTKEPSQAATLTETKIASMGTTTSGETVVCSCLLTYMSLSLKGGSQFISQLGVTVKILG